MLSRRDAIRKLTLVGAGVCIAGPSSLLRAENAGIDAEGKDKIIRAFIDAVVPGADVEHGNVTLVFRDRMYGFSKYRWLFVFDLRNRSRKLFSTGRFDMLTRTQRTEVIENALRSKGLMRRLYSGAIQLSQVAVYTGFYHNPEGCPLIDFQAQFEDVGSSYPAAEQFFGRAMTLNGQPL